MRTSHLFCGAVFFTAVCTAFADDGVWTAGSGVWTGTANWLDGIVPGTGDKASFAGAGGTVTIPDGSPFTLSALLFNTNAANVGWILSGETNTLVAPAEVRVDANVAGLYSVLAGSAGLTKSGNSVLELRATNNLFSGSVTVTGGLVRARSDGSLGPVPGSPVADAIVLDGGGLANYVETLTVNASRGITIGPKHGWLLARSSTDTEIEAPITGSGKVSISRNNGVVVFSNPSNDYSGDTVVGADSVGSWTDASALAVLRLGADEVIPHGAGKGRLFFDGFRRGVLDVNGRSETVNTLAALGELCLTNSAPVPGALKAGADDADFAAAGEVTMLSTLEKVGAGTMWFSDNGRSLGDVRVAAGDFSFSQASALGGLTVVLDGGVLTMTETQPGLLETVGSSSVISLSVPMAATGVRLGTIKGFVDANGFAGATQYGYSGQWYVPAPGVYSFGKAFDDGAYLSLDGQVLLNNSVYNNFVVTQNVAVSAGWHAVDVRFSNGSGGVGPRNNYLAGIIFDPNNTSLTNYADIVAAQRFEDPGDGSVLRTAPLGTSTSVVRARLELAQSGTLDRSGTSASLVWAGDVVAATNAAGTPVLTVSGGAEPFRVGSTNRPAVFDVDVADSNGVTFQDKVWLKTFPSSSSWTLASGADLAAGVPGLLGTGDQNLTAYSLRIPTSDALGAGGETVTVGGSNLAVWFDATRETGGRLFDDPGYAFTASNNVNLSGTGARVGFDGAGTVTYTGSISGSGTLVKTGSGDTVLSAASTFAGAVQVQAGRLLFSADAQLGDSANGVSLSGGYLGNAGGAPVTSARDMQVSAGGFDVSGSTLTLSGLLSGTGTKRGDGTLELSGSAANSAFDLNVLEGAVVLNKSGASAVRSITGVSPGATVRLSGSGGNQIEGGVTLTGGTLDMNGLSETVTQLSGVALSNRVTNGGAAPAALSVGEGNNWGAFTGTLSDGSGELGLTKIGANAERLLGGAEPSSYSGETRVEAGSLFIGAGVRYVRFTVNQTRTAGQNPAVSEFQLTLNGEQILLPSNLTVYATSQALPTGVGSRVIDNNAVTKWLATSAYGQYFRIDLGKPTAFDGYRWYTANDAYERDPVSWTLEVSQDNATWYTVDVRAGQSITATRSMIAGDWSLPVPFSGGYAASPASSLNVLSNAVAAVYTARESVLSVAGLGSLFLAANTELTAEEGVSGFTGRLTGDGLLRIGGAGGETVFSHLSSSPEQTLVNGGSAPLLVRLGGETNGSFTASVADGSAAAGLVKRGSRTVLMHGRASTYTGETRVEEGTLAVLPGALTYRYVKFSPTETRGYSSYPVSLSEFQLVRDGQVVKWPAATVVTATAASHSSYPPPKAIDGNYTTDTGRWITAAGVFPNALIFNMGEPVSFDGYQYYTGTSSGNDNPRDPISWRFEGSQDGVTWTLLDVRTHEAVPDIRGNLVGPYVLGGCALPQEFWTATNSLREKVEAVSARFLRFSPTRMRLGSYEYAGTGFQISELQLLTNGAPVLYPVGTSATAPGGGYTDVSQDLTPTKAVDNIVPTGSTNNRWFSPVMVNPLTVDMGQQVRFDAYRLYTGINGAGRDPLSWTLEVSNNATNWYLVDVQTNWWGTLSRNAMIGEWALNLFARSGASACAIPDASPTTVAAGAVLKLEDGSAETVGPLSGAGTVVLAGGAVFGVNSAQEAAFSGGVTGAGIVAVTGVATQTLSGALSVSGEILVDGGTLSLEGAVLTGVTNIVLRGGVLAGAATVNGDLKVTCEGGRYRANLAVAGALTVSGELLLALPEDAELPFLQRLFSFASADATTQAALEASASTVSVPVGFISKVSVETSSAYWSVAAPGTVLLVK